MRGKRLTVAGSVGLVALVALGLGALRSSDEWSAGVMYLLAILATLTAAMGAAFAAGGTRAFCAGFATFCGAYLVLVFSPWSTANSPMPQPSQARAIHGAPLATVPLLLRLHALRDRPEGLVVGSKVEVLWGSSYWPTTVLEVGSGRYKIHYDNHGSNFDEWVGPDRLGWASRDLGHFLQVGHCLFATIGGVIGAGIALAFFRSRPTCNHAGTSP